MLNSLTNILFVIVFIFSATISSGQENREKERKIASIKFSVVGDLMCHSPQFIFAQTDSGYDFSSNFKYIKKFFHDADFTIGNFETVLAGGKRGYSGYPRFNAPDEYLDAVKDAGFDLLTTSNNHALDKGKSGVLRTIDKIKEAGLYGVGTYKSQAERDSLRIINVNGISFVLLSYSYGTNGMPIPKGEDYLINLIDEELIKKDIQKAKNSGVDLIMVYFHFGNEYQTKPSSYQQDIVKKTIGYGADIILGGHPHVVEPIETFKTNGGNLDSGFVSYSLGNFISNQRWRYSDGGPILNFTVNKNLDKDSLYVNQLEIIPAWVFRGKIDSVDTYTIIPSDSVSLHYRYSFLTSEDEKNMKQSYNDIVNIMSSSYKGIQFYSPSVLLNNFKCYPRGFDFLPAELPKTSIK